MNEKLSELSATIVQTIAELENIHREILEAEADDLEKLGRTNRAALLAAGLIENYYTCLETAFVRISQHFENNLPPDKWHKALLEKMQLNIEGVRAPAVSRENLPRLAEILRFRHFKRYYFQIEYDWRKMDYLLALLKEAHPVALADLQKFRDFLAAI